jgi:hypothetical protein
VRSRNDPREVRVIRVSVEVCRGATRFRAEVWAKSIERALSLVMARYPGVEARVVFPIESEAFFVDSVVSTSEGVSLETPEEVAG